MSDPLFTPTVLYETPEIFGSERRHAARTGSESVAAGFRGRQSLPRGGLYTMLHDDGLT
jgi:hypothetical protein